MLVVADIEAIGTIRLQADKFVVEVRDRRRQTLVPLADFEAGTIAWR